MADYQSKLNSCLFSVWLKKQLLNLSSGILAFIRWAVMLFILGILIDWQTFMPMPGRIIIFTIMLVGTLVMAWRKGLNKLCPFSPRNTALQIEKSLGKRDSLLVTAVQFNTKKRIPSISEDMVELTCKRAETEIRKLKDKRIVSIGILKRPALYLLILAVLMGVLSGISIKYMGSRASLEFLTVGVKRLFPPWKSEKYPTRTKIKMVTDNMFVKEGAQALIKAKLSGIIPNSAEIRIRPAIGKAFDRPVPIKDALFNYEISSAYQSFEYRIFAGDDRSEWQSLTVIPAPRIKKAEVDLDYPAYTKKPSEKVDALTMTVPEGTGIKWVLYLDRAVSEAKVLSPGSEPKSLKVSDDGMVVEMEELASSSRAYSFTWKEKSHGYNFKSPNNYLQVQPDEEPQVELTKPEKNMFATLGRELKLAYRARDDHGISEANIGYWVNKLEEKKIKINPPQHDELGEIVIDWDYRQSLKSLKVGDTVTFVIEIADRYPGKKGPHRARSQTRRLSILSKQDYLTRMYKQKVRLLTQVKNIYREERKVHNLIKEFDPASDNFIQACQMEVVRQELIRERLLEIKEQMGKLVDDLAANGFTEKIYTEELIHLQTELQRIADDNIKLVSNKLKDLSIASTDPSKNADITEAVDAVNLAARELGIMVLQLGFKEATEVMAREIHTLAEDQAYLRWKTILADDSRKKDLMLRQNDLAAWLLRLLSSIPEDRESSEADALVAFKLSRLRKELTRASTAPTMRTIGDSIGQVPPEKNAALQAKVIKALLKAEFRLRKGLEYAALVRACELFNGQADSQKALREAIEDMSPEEFRKRKGEIKKVQQILSKKLTLLLMPEIPNPRCRLLDAVKPGKPEVEKLLAESVRSQNIIANAIDSGERDKAIAELVKSEKTFTSLAYITDKRIEQLSESKRVNSIAAVAGARISKISTFTEQLSSILEKTEDAAFDETDSAFIIPLVDRLALDLDNFKHNIKKENQRLLIHDEGKNPLVAYLNEAVVNLEKSSKAIKVKKLSEAIKEQKKVNELLNEMVELLTKQSEDASSFSTALSMDRVINEPGPLMKDIQSEQYDILKTAKATKDDDLPGLAMAQKNLIHAVNAVLAYLDPFSHHIETGSVMLFAKDDMDAAAVGLKDKDREEAIDAGSFVAESLQKILDQLTLLAPQYTYVMELVEFIHEGLSENISLEALQRELQSKCVSVTSKAELAELTARQEALLQRSRKCNKLMVEVTGIDQLSDITENMEAVLETLKTGDSTKAAEKMNEAILALESGNEKLLRLNKLLVLILAPPLAPMVPPEFSFLVDFTSMATQNKRLYRLTNTTSEKEAGKLSSEQAKLAKQCEQFIKRYDSLERKYIAQKVEGIKKVYSRMRNPKVPLQQAVAEETEKLKISFAESENDLNSAQKLMQQAEMKLKNGAVKEAIIAQRDSATLLRKFYINNILMFISEPGPPPSLPPAPSDESSTEDSFELFTPGAVSGKKIRGGKLEWQVLGRRERAALNENFARELPLEFREILKDYYRRLAE